MNPLNGKVLISEPDTEKKIMNQEFSLFKDGQVIAQACFPPKPYEDDLTEEQILRDVLFKVMNSSCKMVKYCELSGTFVDNEEKLEYERINGSGTIVPIPYGCILFKPEYMDKKIIIDKMFEIEYDVVNKFQFMNKDISEIDFKISIMRSSGEIDREACIYKENHLRFSSNKNKWGFTVKVTSEEQYMDMTKFVYLTSIKEFNPELFPITVYLNNNVPDWLLEERTIWIEKVKQSLNDEMGEDVIIKIEND